MMKLRKLSSTRAKNRAGEVFTFDEFKCLLFSVWTPGVENEYTSDFVTYMVHFSLNAYKFMAMTLLLGALRTEQFERFRKGGLEAITSAIFLHFVYFAKCLYFIAIICDDASGYSENVREQKNKGEPELSFAVSRSRIGSILVEFEVSKDDQFSNIFIFSNT